MIDSFSANKFLGETKTSITPNLDSLISRGTYFEQAISVASTTVPSYSSVFTGLYPFQCVTKKNNVILLNTNLKTYVQKFEEMEYQIFADLPEIIAVSGLNKIFKNCNTFDTFATLYDGVGKQIEEKLLKLKEPWFYYIHLMDLHGSVNMNQNKKLNNFTNQKYGKNSYDRMASAMDYWIGKIISKINFENTILIITADHGSPISEYTEIMENESEKSIKKRDHYSKFSYKFSHKIITHFPESLNFVRRKLSKSYLANKNKSISKDVQSRLKEINSTSISPKTKRLLENSIMTTGNLYDETCRIPLLFYGYSIPKGKIISQQVKNIDIFPTIHDIINTNLNDNYFGKSLYPLIKDEKFEEEPILLQTITNSDLIKPKIGIRTNNYKYFRNDEKDSQVRFLFNLNEDPLEENNISENEKNIMENFEKQISDILQKGKITSHTSKISKKEMDDARDLIKELGYI